MPADQALDELLVRRATWAAEGVLVFDLARADGGALPAWEPGAHLDVVTPSGLVRQYSLCGDPDDHSIYQIAVLRETESRGGSQELHGTQLVGRRLAVRGPRNHFRLVDAAGYLFLAGGIGVTPIVAMVRAVERAGRPWRMVYGGRSRQTMAFLDELGTRAGGTLDVVPEDERGLPDLDAALRDLPSGWRVYCCGPPGMLEAVEKRCAALDPGVLHLERFTASPDAVAPAGGETFEVELARSGIVLTVPPDRSLLRVILDAVPSVLYSCEEGYCGTCEVNVIAGTPDHRDTVLTDEERAEGKMMICVGRSASPRLVLDL